MKAGSGVRAEFSAAEARRIALSAQGFGVRRSEAPSRWPQVEAAIRQMGFLQLDSVNVLVRSHYLPVYSRLGSYPASSLDARAFAAGPKRAFFEYWAHEASLLPIDLQPLFRWRMQRAEDGLGIYGGVHRFASENPAYVAATLAEIVRNGARSASELDDPGKRNGPWWGWHKGKIALEYLFWTGKVTTAFRRGFERVYDLPERVLPAEVLQRPTPSAADGARELARLGAKAHGIATEAEIRDYFRLPVAETRQAIAELVEAGRLAQVAVEGWRQPAYFDPEQPVPARLLPTALLSPFDPLVSHRERTERIFDFHYRLEFYTPGHKRNFGYFVMPFLHRGRIEARVDLKADRKAGRLLVLGVFPEKGVRQVGPMLEALAGELRHLAAWLALPAIAVTPGAAAADGLSVALGDLGAST
jgi:hypothetical protein